MQKEFRIEPKHHKHFQKVATKRITKSSYALRLMTIIFILSFLLSSGLIFFFIYEKTIVYSYDSLTLFDIELKYWVAMIVYLTLLIHAFSTIIYRHLFHQRTVNPDGLIYGDWHLSADVKSIEFAKRGIKAIYDWIKFNQIYIDDIIVVLWSDLGEGVIIPTNTFANKSEFDHFVKLSQITSMDYKVKSKTFTSEAI